IKACQNRGHPAAASSARLSSSTLTRGSPRTPSCRPSVYFCTSSRRRSSWMPLALEIRGIWYSAAAGEMWGSSPEPDAVTRSAGTGVGPPKSLMRLSTASFSAGLVGPWFEPDDEAPLYGMGEVAEGRVQKYFGSENACPISLDPTTLPPFKIRLPFA